MRRITRFFLACCLLNSLSSCSSLNLDVDASSDFAPLFSSSDQIETRARQQTRDQLLKRYETVFQHEFWPSVIKDDENLSGEGGNYQYWWNHRSQAKSGEELELLCAIPKDKLSGMSTRNLVLTCYIYPYLGTFWAHNDPRTGLFGQMARFNGLLELQLRKNAPAELIKLYKEIKDTGSTGQTTVLDYKDYAKMNTIFGLPSLTMILESAVDYGCISKAQVKELAAAILEKIDQADKLPEGTRSWSTASYPYVLGAMLAYHHDSSLTDEQVQMMVRFIGVGSSFPGTPMEYNEASGKYYASEETIQRYRDVILASLDRLRR